MIAIGVNYTFTGKSRKKTRNVIGIICPTALMQAMFKYKAQPIYVDLGDVEADYSESAGLRMIYATGDL